MNKKNKASNKKMRSRRLPAKIYRGLGAQGRDRLTIKGHFPISTSFTSAAGKVITIAPTISNCGQMIDLAQAYQNYTINRVSYKFFVTNNVNTTYYANNVLRSSKPLFYYQVPLHNDQVPTDYNQFIAHSELTCGQYDHVIRGSFVPYSSVTDEATRGWKQNQ